MDDLGIRPRDLAADLDITPGAVAHLIALQRRMPTPDMLVKLADALEVSVPDLVNAALGEAANHG
jgi:plasmid maintenance system antidote protein VapI